MNAIFLFFYDLLAPLAAAAYLVRFSFSPRRKVLGRLGSELKERFALAEYPRNRSPIWIHASSVGEVKALKSFAEGLRKKFPGSQILVTATTAGGRAEAGKIADYAFLAPLDFSFCADKFVNAVSPAAFLITETELWPNMINAVLKRKIPLFLINARMSKGTFKFYRAISPLLRPLLRGAKGIFCQSPGDLERYEKLLKGDGNLRLTGNIKYDNVAAGPGGRLRPLLSSAFENRRVLLCASVWPDETPVIAGAYLALKKTFRGLRLMLAPRHVERSGEIMAHLRLKGIHCAKFSEIEKIKSETEFKNALSAPDALVIDAMGLLADFYPAASAVFVGGTLNKAGGHNLLEPAAFSKPVLFGPNYENAREAGQRLILNGGGFTIKTPEDFAGRVSLLLNNPVLMKNAEKGSRKALEALRGATDRTIKELEI